MPILSPIGRKAWPVRLLIAGIYLTLVLGAVTMIYPFLVIVAGSGKSAVDEKEFGPVPGYATSDSALYRKHVQGLFNEETGRMRAIYDLDTTFESLEAPPPAEALVTAWEAFLLVDQPPEYSYTLGYLHTPVSRTLPSTIRELKSEMIDRFDRISALNAEMGTEFINWNAFEVHAEYYLPRRNAFIDSQWYREVREFKQRQPDHLRQWFNVEGFYKSDFLRAQYTRDIAAYNESHGTTYASWNDVQLPPRPTGTEKEQADWEDFTRNTLNLLWVRLDDEATADYRAFLAAKYGDIAILNRLYGGEHADFGSVPLPQQPVLPEAGGVVLSDWDAFIKGWTDTAGKEHKVATPHLSIDCLDLRFRNALRDWFADVEVMNHALGTAFPSFDVVTAPRQQLDYRNFLERRSSLRTEFATRNFRAVWDYIAVHGRGVLNTVIYCLLAVLSSLIVNPLAAYALSRYKLRNTYTLLLFMLLTMAFPPMVTQIPVFLMLRDFNLLNTFAALILPSMAHGYSIFLLKGFFDSLPSELYESAQMDGAGEWRMFWTITMSLSKPILAVIALTSFVTAYSNFMFALLICQDESMWTLMVWLYQLQQNSGQGVIYASLLIAAIPTFLIFLFCQNLIMRGIVVPVEK